MGMSTRAVGFMPRTDDYRKKVEAWRACVAADLSPPQELLDLFEENEPDDAGMPVDIGAACSECEVENGSGIQVDITKLPPGVTVVRFCNSW